MHQRLTQSVKASMILLPLLRDDTAVTSNFVDMTDYEYVDFLILVGATDTTVDANVEESTAADGSIPTDVSDSAITQITGLGDNVMCIISVKKDALTKRYVGLTVDPGDGINGANVAAVAIRYGKSGTIPETAETAGSNSYATSQTVTV